MVDGSCLQRAMLSVSAASIGLAAVMTGCAGSETAVSGPVQRLDARDFRDASAPDSPTPPVPEYREERARAPRVEIQTLSEQEARGEVGRTTIEPGEPVRPPDEVARATPSVRARADLTGLRLVDAKVGDVNGRPIIAERWLEPMAARLRAESVGRSRDEWRVFAAEEIRGRLITDLSNELFLAESRASLTPQQKAGLRVFLERFQREQVSANYGSQELARQQLLRTQGQTLEQATRERERAVLIVEQLRKVVWDRVQVGSRDIRNEYDRNLDKYQPPPTAVFHLISVRNDDEGAAEEIATALQSSTFLEVADDARNNANNPYEFTLAGTLAESELFGPAALSSAAASLSPGGFTGPIELGPSSYWIYLERIDQTFVSLYDAQRELRDTITERRREEEERRYLYKLFARAGIRDAEISALITMLVQVAEEWYYQPNG